MSSSPKSAAALTPRAGTRGRWVIVLLAAMLVLFGGVLALLAYVTGAGALGFMPPQMAAARYTPKDVVGDLGGMPVTIARHIPQFVEYDGDPGWGEKRKGPPPERTHASRLASFGFDLRYPDMATLSSPELQQEFVNKRLHEHSWIRVSVQSGSSYPGDGYLDRRYQATIPNDPTTQSIHSQLAPQPSSIKGLELFVPRGNDPHTGHPWRYAGPTGDIYIHRNREGKVTTFIRCTFRSGTQQYATCSQDSSMEEHGLAVQLTATYVPDLLPQWQDIQDRVSQFVLDFRRPQATPIQAPTR